MQSFGLDLSTDPAKVWWAIVDWSGGRPRLSSLTCAAELPEPPRDDDALAEQIAGALAAFDPGPQRVAGIDAPLGWPRAFVEAVRGWQESAHPRLRKSESLRLRPTDQFVKAATGHTPMSVSTDRIGSTALLTATLLSRLTEHRGTEILDRASASEGIAEVYPSAALRCWTTAGGEPLPIAGYKTEPEARALLVEILSEVVACTTEQRGAMVARDDALDALLCALVARAVATGNTLSVQQPVTPELLPLPSGDPATAERRREQRAARAELMRLAGREHAAREGWIHLPVAGPLSALD